MKVISETLMFPLLRLSESHELRLAHRNLKHAWRIQSKVITSP